MCLKTILNGIMQPKIRKFKFSSIPYFYSIHSTVRRCPPRKPENIKNSIKLRNYLRLNPFASPSITNVYSHIFSSPPNRGLGVAWFWLCHMNIIMTMAVFTNFHFFWWFWFKKKKKIIKFIHLKWLKTIKNWKKKKRKCGFFDKKLLWVQK